MKARRIFIAAAIATVAALGGFASTAKGDPAGNAVTEWSVIASNTLVAFPAPAGGAAPALQINMGMTQGAVYDALNAISPRHHRPYLLKRRFSARANKDAATAAAAYRVLKNVVETVPATIPFPNRQALLTALLNEYNAAIGEIPNSPFKTQGINAGEAAAEAMIAARQDDGRFGPSQWEPNDDPGHWQPLIDPNTGLPILDPTPWVGRVRPFLMRTSSQFRTAGPLDYRSAAYAQEFNEVKSLGAINSLTRTMEQTHNAIFWQSAGGPALLWTPVARTLVSDPANHLDMTDAARLLAMMHLSAADAAINCWNDKYHFDFWRPWNAIHRADEDDNPGTERDPDWAALITAPYPDHPSGHLCLDGAHLTTLAIFFGTDDIGFDVTSSRFPNDPPRHFDAFSEPLVEITEARIWAGLHFRTADVQGRGLGRNVAEFMADNYFQQVGN
jgi:hypothetical protein